MDKFNHWKQVTCSEDNMLTTKISLGITTGYVLITSTFILEITLLMYNVFNNKICTVYAKSYQVPLNVCCGISLECKTQMSAQPFFKIYLIMCLHS